MRIPTSVRMVAEVIGLDAAVRLIPLTGKNNAIYVPANPVKPGHRLSAVLEPDELRKLQRHFGGELMNYVDERGAQKIALANRRRAQIIALSRRGTMSKAEIAREVGCARSLVVKVLKAHTRRQEAANQEGGS